MKMHLPLLGLMVAVLSLSTSCTYHTYHFGVANRAAMVPDDFGQTEVALAEARQSQGAGYCPEKVAQAEELAHKGAEVYWACRNTESSELLAQARQLAKEAEGCGPKAVAAPPAPVKMKPPTCNLTVSPSSITKGRTATLSWSSMNSDDCNIQPGIGPVETSGRMDITPRADTAYTLTCTGEGGKATSKTEVKVVVPQPPAPAREDLCMSLKIEFDTDKSEIKPAYFDQVEKVADFMKKYPQLKGTIEGHTDNVGGAGYNQRLSQRRADSVMRMLIDKYGIDRSRLTATGYGLSRPIADNGTKEGRQKNRRTLANFGCQ